VGCVHRGATQLKPTLFSFQKARFKSQSCVKACNTDAAMQCRASSSVGDPSHLKNPSERYVFGDIVEKIIFL